MKKCLYLKRVLTNMFIHLIILKNISYNLIYSINKTTL